jgi:hypothetical protein
VLLLLTAPVIGVEERWVCTFASLEAIDDVRDVPEVTDVEE